jgi:hypothetical protein
MLSRYFLNDSEMVPVNCIITGITYGFAYHIRCIPIVNKCISNLLASVFITFLFPENTVYINRYILIHCSGLRCPVHC